MPDESAPHRAVWMAFAARESVWTAPMRQPVQQALARIANAISVYEPVKMLVGADDFATARQLCGSNVQLIVHELDDLWMRDTGCVFVRNTRGDRAAVSFNFNGWGNKQPHARDAIVAARMAELSGVPLLRSRLVMEGGGIEVDGQGTAIITESCVLNGNRNPGVSKATPRRSSSACWAWKRSSGCPASPTATSPTATPISTPASSSPAWSSRRWRTTKNRSTTR